MDDSGYESFSDDDNILFFNQNNNLIIANNMQNNTTKNCFKHFLTNCKTILIEIFHAMFF